MAEVCNTSYLIHAPYGGREARCGAWRALVEAHEEGKIRSLGVSNYGVHHLDELDAYIKELEETHGKGKGGAISVGQWEVHPWLGRKDIVDWCAKKGVVVEVGQRPFPCIVVLKLTDIRRIVLW